MADILLNIISAPLSWYDELLRMSSLSGFYLMMIFLAILGSRLLKPLFGSVGSDKVKKPRAAKKDTEG